MFLNSIFGCLSKAESKVQAALAGEWAAIPAADKTELLVILQAANIIKANSTLNGDELLALITQATGQPFVDKWLAIVDKVAASIGITIPAGSTPIQTVQLIAADLTPRSGDNWADTVLRIASYSLSNLVPGGGIVREVAIPLVQWVYDNVFKPATALPANVVEAANIVNNLATAATPQSSSNNTAASITAPVAPAVATPDTLNAPDPQFPTE